MLYIFDVLGPSLLDEYCCGMARFAVFCYCERVSLPSSCTILLSVSVRFVDGDGVPVSVFTLALLLDELGDLVVACH